MINDLNATAWLHKYDLFDESVQRQVLDDLACTGVGQRPETGFHLADECSSIDRLRFGFCKLFLQRCKLLGNPLFVLPVFFQRVDTSLKCFSDTLQLAFFLFDKCRDR